MAFFGFGLIATTDNEVFDRKEVWEMRNNVTPKFHTQADNFLQFSPIATVYALNCLGVKGQHNVINQTLLIVKSEVILAAMVIPLKHITGVPRPDTGARTSFPSGHTAQAFAAAAFLHKEYGKDHPIVSVLGYSLAGGIGMLRVLNNRHWFSDVLAGAGIGILSTNLAYLTHQNKFGQRHDVLKGARLVPMFGQGALGMYVALPYTLICSE